jgi:hypothetical protein
MKVNELAVLDSFGGYVASGKTWRLAFEGSGISLPLWVVCPAGVVLLEIGPLDHFVLPCRLMRRRPSSNRNVIVCIPSFSEFFWCFPCNKEFHCRWRQSTRLETARRQRPRQSHVRNHSPKDFISLGYKATLFTSQAVLVRLSRQLPNGLPILRFREIGPCCGSLVLDNYSTRANIPPPHL